MAEINNNNDIKTETAIGGQTPSAALEFNKDGSMVAGDSETGSKAKANKKEHKLGELIKIKAHALSPTEKKSQIFCSINQYNFEFQQNTEVMLPKGVVKFLQGCTKIVHTVDSKGKPIAKTEPLYAVSIIL